MVKDKFVIKQIKFNSNDYHKSLQLRNEVLRLPLGMSLFNEELGKEIHDFHLAIFSDTDIIGTLVLTPYSGYVKMRQVAIAEEWRGKKAGSKIVEFSEVFSRENGFTRIELNARSTAVPFYLGRGYTIISEEFQEVSIPHLKMKKDLSF